MNIQKLAAELGKKLQNSGQKLAIAESLTGGRLQAAITSVSGASTFFAGGITAYHIDQKVSLLGVDRNHASQVNCVSERVACELATGACDLFGCKIACATTGYAEPCPDEGIEKPFAWIAFGVAGTLSSLRVEATATQRTSVQEEICHYALEQLLKFL